MDSHQIKIRSMWLVLSIGVLLMLIKFAAYLLTGSNAILTDALESIINVVAGGFALYSLYYAAQPKDEDHPYGHGKIEYMSAGFEGGMIFLAGAAMIVKGIYAFFNPGEIRSLDLGIYLSSFAGLVNYIMGAYLIKQGKKHNSTLLIADGKHLISDTVSSIGIIAGLVVIFFTNIYWLDNILTIVFGAFIFHTGYKLIKQSIPNLLDRADHEKLQHLIDILMKSRRDKWIDIHNLRVLKYGPQLHVDCHITLPWYNSLEESHAEVSMVETIVKKDMGDDIEFFIHSDPCIPVASCQICQLKNCRERKADFSKKIEWSIENMLPDKKHQL